VHVEFHLVEVALGDVPGNWMMMWYSHPKSGRISTNLLEADVPWKNDNKNRTSCELAMA